MQITHEQAHKLIQLNIDQALSAQETVELSAHLRDCLDCRSYASDLKEVEHLLFPFLKRQWHRRPIPLSITALTEGSLKTQASSLLATRTAAIGLIVVALFFSVWQFLFSGSVVLGQVPHHVPPIPTPSVHTASATNVSASLENCKSVLYTVQRNETLAEIAIQFSVSQEEIMELNHLKAAIISPSMELIIPLCNFTPTGTVHPATFTITYTPITKPTTSTPGG